MNVVITGASRGLGLGFARHYLNKGYQVWGCYRSEPAALGEIDSSNLKLVQWDVGESKDESSIAGLGFPESIDLLINNAGIYGPTKEAGQSLSDVSSETMHTLFDVNCLGALRVVQALQSRIIAARGKIANLSSKMGSSMDNSSGGCYAYRASKAALVIVSKSMAIDLAEFGVEVITLHPGWVRTDMTSHSGLISVDESVAGMTEVIEGLDRYPLGAFVAFDGKLIPF